MDVPHSPTQACIALGGNLGSVAQTFQLAVYDLDRLKDTTVTAVSPFFEFRAVGDQAGDAFLNAACTLETRLSPRSLLHELHQIEARLGRVREAHWGPRTLDLDLILFGQENIESLELTVPHPACWYRRFVLDPLVAVAADAIHPLKGAPMEDLRARLLVRPFPVGLCGDTQETRVSIMTALESAFPEVVWSTNWNRGESRGLLFRLGTTPEWDALPLPPRIQVPDGDPVTFVCDVLSAALTGPASS